MPGTNGGTTTFKYDPFGRRIQKSGPLGTTNYLYDGYNDIDGSWSPTLDKERQGWGTHFVADVAEIKSLGHPP